MISLTKRLGIAICALSLMGTAALATPLNLIEGSDDFDTLAPEGSVLGTLGVGTNTISGSIAFSCALLSVPCDPLDGSDTRDDIRLRLAEGTQIVPGGGLTASNATINGFVEFYSGEFLVAFSLPFGGGVVMNNLFGETDGPTDIVFSVAASLAGFSFDPQGFDYTITFDVIQTGSTPPDSAVVPVPAGGLLLLSALGAGALLRRNRATRA